MQRTPEGLPAAAQRTFLAVGSVLILLGAVPVFFDGSLEDLASLVFLMIVLWAAVLGGTGPGAIGAAAATAGYALLRLPDYSDDPTAFIAVAARGVAFVAVGLGSGFFLGRVRTMLSRTNVSGIRDTETGTFSPTYMQQLLSLEIEEHLRYGKPFGLLMIETKDFPVAQAVERLRRQLRASDTVGRSFTGGLVVILAHADEAALKVATNRVRQSIGHEAAIQVYRAPDDLDSMKDLAGHAGPVPLRQR